MSKSYKMVKAYGEASFIEKKSRFIGYTSPVYSEEEAVQFINSIKKKHYDAAHNCSAFVIGANSEVQRSSDDGEPSGTAGVPILEVIRKGGLTNTAVVVTRYFGGIMLGAGGLIRAYTEGAAIGIKAAGIIRVQPFSLYSINIDYSLLSKLQYELPRKSFIISEVEYLDRVTMKVLSLPEAALDLEESVVQWTSGSAVLELLDTRLLKLDEDNKIIDTASL